MKTNEREVALLSFWIRVLVVGALLVFFALAVDTARQKSPTNDEPVHLARGVAVWQTADLRLQYEHTPLSHRLIGLLLLTEPTMPDITTLTGWGNGDRPQLAEALLWRNGVDVGRVLFLGRLGIIWLALLAGAVVARWVMEATTAHLAKERTRTETDERGILLGVGTALVLFACSPNFLASAALATTDMAAAATYLATLFAWWHYWQRPGWGRWLLTGVCLGLALAAKLTGVLLVPLLLLLALLYCGEGGKRPWLVWLALLPVAGLVVWLVYGLEIGPLLGTAIPVLAPTYWQSWSDVLRHVDGGHPAFFLGDISSDGWWSYFPVAFLIKTPIPMLALLVLTLFWAIRSDRRRATPARQYDDQQSVARHRFLAFTLLAATVAFAAAVVSRLNIGYRHILPVLPLIWVAVSVMGVPRLEAGRLGRWVLMLGLGWVAFGAIRQHPHHLAYFNELIGGSGQGYRYLSDSNLDWGQDLKLLADEAAAYEAEAGMALYYSYGGVADPAYYGLLTPALAGADGRGLASFSPANPAAGRYAIGAGQWQGLLPEGDPFDWFRRQEPTGTVGYSILTYEVGEQAMGKWMAHCLAPGPLLTTAEAERIVGQTGLRHVVFDCQQSWVFPDDGAAGWYILPLDEAATWLVEDAPEMVTAVYRHQQTADAPGYAVYYHPGNQCIAAALSFAGEEVQMADGTAAALPVAASPSLWLEGYQQSEEEWRVLWRVEAAVAEPLSLLAHLYREGSATPLVADGLGYTAEQWRPGDWFIQRHRFPGGAEGEYLETGVYNYLSQEGVGERLRLVEE